MEKKLIDTATPLNPMKIIKRSAKYFYYLLKREKFNFEQQDIEGEFGVVYTIALKAWDASKTASFETYLTKCFENRINRMRTEATNSVTWNYEDCGSLSNLSANSDSLDRQAGKIVSDEDIYNKIEAADILTKISNRIPKSCGDIFKRMLAVGSFENVTRRKIHYTMTLMRAEANYFKK